MRRLLFVFALLAFTSQSFAGVCGKAGIATGTASVAAKALTPVMHSSGKLILRGATGYIAGTLGLAAETVAVLNPIGWVVLGASVVYVAYQCVSDESEE